jgi:hypothetical protein
MIVAEQSTAAPPPYHVPCLTTCGLPCDQLVVKPLMIALMMIMSQILLDHIITNGVRPTVSLDVISLVASSCGYYRGQIKPHAAQ